MNIKPSINLASLLSAPNHSPQFCQGQLNKEVKLFSVLRAGALGRPRGMGWRGRRERGSGWGTHVNPWLIHVNIWQKPLQYRKVISFQLIKINGKKFFFSFPGKQACFSQQLLLHIFFSSHYKFLIPFFLFQTSNSQPGLHIRVNRSLQK